MAIVSSPPPYGTTEQQRPTSSQNNWLPGQLFKHVRNSTRRGRNVRSNSEDNHSYQQNTDDEKEKSLPFTSIHEVSAPLFESGRSSTHVMVKPSASFDDEFHPDINNGIFNMQSHITDTNTTMPD
eukprot:CAMPEP_0194422610 /NCGR_PEP_ID=MMETSP0176-20130528/21911_1 /TAXON_ID=216777 /ORGANISM="Proboscia alata, Strain PI-D3" /LENGTH=124 /DNA_ID=CAMNT_0039231433 /DNA_START=171 /DNA_END=542 /DNA_ORIENTATION=-